MTRGWTRLRFKRVNRGTFLATVTVGSCGVRSMNFGTKQLTSDHLRAASELGMDHAEEGRLRLLNAFDLWPVIVNEGRDQYVSGSYGQLHASYTGGHANYF
jgi:hypothetical protein